MYQKISQFLLRNSVPKKILGQQFFSRAKGAQDQYWPPGRCDPVFPSIDLPYGASHTVYRTKFGSVPVTKDRSCGYRNMAPQYKLIYFDLTGLGEPIRFLLSYGGLEFVDQRVPKEEWAAFKPKTPLGQMPLLEVNGKVLYQSLAIVRYLGNVVGLSGKTPLENWEIDAAADTVNDLRAKVGSWCFEQNEEVKKTLKESLEKESLPFLLSKLDSWAKQNNGYLAIGKLTWADLFFVAIIDFLSYLLSKDPISNYPNLLAVRKNVLAIPKVKAWVDKRPAETYLNN